jgi:hypothetical protein
LWWDSTGGQLYIYYDDSTSQQWVITVNAGFTGASITGTPVAGQWAQWTDATHIQGQTPTQATATLDLFTTSLKGLVPASGGGTTNFLRADGAFAAPAAGLVINVQRFAASGTYAPIAGLAYAIIECVGGGGAGGGAASTTFTYAGGGGGAGGYSRKLATAAAIGASQVVTVGAGGLGVAAANGNPGGDSSVGSLCVAKGGSGGSKGDAATVPPGGAGGVTTGAIGDLTAGGAPGERGFYNNLNSAIVGASGAGGSSIFGGGAVGAWSPGNGINASNYGSGGSGGCANGSGSPPGGNGSAGVVFITEYR